MSGIRGTSLWLLLLPCLVLMGCDDDLANEGDGGVEMVLVNGVVIDLDRGMPAEGFAWSC